MAHSSGGGSHSGGFSGGSGFSSSRSISSSSYYYSSGGGSGSLDVSPLEIIGAVIIVMMVITAIIMPRKMTTPYTPAVEIVDNSHRMSEEDEAVVKEGAMKVYDVTGVPICIVFDMNAKWQPRYESLEVYSYDLYVNKYDDEDHWLIVYSYDGVDRQKENRFSDWYFHGIQGDNTDIYLTPSMTSKFNQELTKALMDKDNTTANAFYLAFENMVKNVH